MKVIDTLNTYEKKRLILGYTPYFFSKIFEGVFDGQYSTSLAHMFYLSRSAQKTISPSFEILFSALITNDNEKQEAEDTLAMAIRTKYLRIWSKMYEYLINTEYDALNTTDIEEIVDRDDTRTTAYGKITDIQGTNKVNARENVGTYEQVTTLNNDEASVLGFNSDTPVGTDQNRGSETVVTEGDSIRNRTDSENNGSNTSKETNSGADTHTYQYDEKITKKGRYGYEPQVLIEKELNLRNKHILFEMVLGDLDRELTLSIYER